MCLYAKGYIYMVIDHVAFLNQSGRIMHGIESNITLYIDLLYMRLPGSERIDSSC